MPTIRSDQRRGMHGADSLFLALGNDWCNDEQLQHTTTDYSALARNTAVCYFVESIEPHLTYLLAWSRSTYLYIPVYLHVQRKLQTSRDASIACRR